MATKIVDVTRKGDKQLPETVRVFHIEYTDPESGLTHTGDFTVRRLTLGLIRQTAVRKAQLNGGLSEEALDSNVRYFNAMLAHLEFAISAAPPWWRPDDFYNADVISDVYEEVMRFEGSFRAPVGRRPQGATGDSEKQPPKPQGDAPQVVDEEVSATSYNGSLFGV